MEYSCKEKQEGEVKYPSKEELAGDVPVTIMTSCISSNRFHKIFLHPSEKFLTDKEKKKKDRELLYGWKKKDSTSHCL